MVFIWLLISNLLYLYCSDVTTINTKHKHDMATRAQIKIEGITYAKVYKHWDGYPSDMLPWLEKFNQDFTENRGDDPEYKFAQLLRNSVRVEDEFGLDNSEHTGWGVIPYNSSPDAYTYTLHRDGKVTYVEHN